MGTNFWWGWIAELGWGRLLDALADLECSLQGLVAFGVHWAHQGSQRRLIGTLVQRGAPISRPGVGGGDSGSNLLWQPVAPCGGLWQISVAPLRWYKVGCILQPVAQ